MPNVSFFTPIQEPAAGTPWDKQPEGSIFSPLKINGMTLQNRVIVSPMCQYSAKDGYMTMWHHTHLGGFASRGVGLVMTEVHAVSPEGRISPQDLGLWEDGQIEGLRKIVEFVHSQSVKFGVQIGHAGRKASTVVPWVDRKAAAGGFSGGWPNVIAASPEPYSSQTVPPHEATREDIMKFKQDWTEAVRRALKAGVDVIEIHGAHGYLLHSFYSPSSNHRTDEYGGCFENRIRLILEVVDILKAEAPEDFPIMFRISATDYLEWDPSIPQFTIDEGVKLCKALADRGVHFIDVSAGGLDARQKIKTGPGYQVPCNAKAIKKAVAGTGCLVGTVGEITSGKQAQAILDAGSADAVLVGRAFLKNPSLVSTWADELD
ncbi:hypothetical protein BJ170DRAFT_691847 [Xylariales sp. AK1849]|nr:hypothetical protein BJ170DRAFT_691847 [Xylariales sp. AK1849]